MPRENMTSHLLAGSSCKMSWASAGRAEGTDDVLYDAGMLSMLVRSQQQQPNTGLGAVSEGMPKKSLCGPL